MLGAVVVLGGVVCLFLWWLTKNYDEEGNSTSTSTSTSSKNSRRGKKNKKGKNRRNNGGQHPPDTDSHGGKEQLRNADGSGVSVTGGTGQRQSMQQRRGAGGQVLDSQDWPTLGRPPKELEEEEENLAALHAEMLKTTRSAASTADRNVPGVAAKEKLKAGVRSNGRIGVGDKVEGRFEAGTEWFPATVTKTLHGGLVNLLYDDGEPETRVPLSLVRHRGAQLSGSSDSDANSDSDGSEKETEIYGRPAAQATKNMADGWEVMVQKPKKTRVERIESRAEANSNLKNRLKRQKKREKELAAREALRKKL